MGRWGAGADTYYLYRQEPDPEMMKLWQRQSQATSGQVVIVVRFPPSPQLEECHYHKYPDHE